MLYHISELILGVINNLLNIALHDLTLITDCLWLRDYRGFVN